MATLVLLPLSPSRFWIPERPIFLPNVLSLTVLIIFYVLSSASNTEWKKLIALFFPNRRWWLGQRRWKIRKWPSDVTTFRPIPFERRGRDVIPSFQPVRERGRGWSARRRRGFVRCGESTRQRPEGDGRRHRTKLDRQVGLDGQLMLLPGRPQLSRIHRLYY